MVSQATGARDAVAHTWEVSAPSPRILLLTHASPHPMGPLHLAAHPSHAAGPDAKAPE